MHALADGLLDVRVGKPWWAVRLGRWSVRVSQWIVTLTRIASTKVPSSTLFSCGGLLNSRFLLTCVQFATRNRLLICGPIFHKPVFEAGFLHRLCFCLHLFHWLLHLSVYQDISLTVEEWPSLHHVDLLSIDELGYVRFLTLQKLWLVKLRYLRGLRDYCRTLRCLKTAQDWQVRVFEKRFALSVV